MDADVFDRAGPLRSYGRRRGKPLRPRRADALDNVLPRVRITLPADNAMPLDPRTLFPFAAVDMALEVGFGSGEHLLRQAAARPEAGFIGCEPFVNGVAALCADIAEKGIGNIRIWPDDARLLMARLPATCLNRFYLLHPDPWPKARHHKRRFLQAETLDDIARLLKPGGALHMATDHAELAEWLREHAAAHPLFRAEPADSAADTRYAHKGQRQGRASVYFLFRRVGD